MRRTGVAVMLLATTAAAAGAQRPVRLELVRCTATSDAPCLRTTVPLDDVQRSLASRIDSARLAAAWSAALPGATLVGPGAALPGGQALPVDLLVLIDRGGAMTADGAAFTRTALASWLATLDSGSVRVAVLTLDDAATRQPVDSFTYRSPQAATALLAQLPPLSPRAPSPLLSAMAAIAAGSPDTSRQRALLVLTAGRNQVGRGRDAARFLAGDSGLQIAARSAAARGIRTWVVAVGADSTAAMLRTLAGPRGSVFLEPADPNALAARLRAIAREFIGERHLTFGVTGDGVAGLARLSAVGTVTLRGEGDTTAATPVEWRPPLLAMPAFRGVADSAALGDALQEAMLLSPLGGSNRPMIALLLAAIVASGWLLLGRLGWREPAPVASARDRGGSPTRTGSVTPLVAPAAPRRPEDITQQTARHTALRR